MRLAIQTKCLAFLLVAFVAATPGQAKVRDKRPPQLDHTPIERAPVGENIEVNVVIKDKSGVFDPTLYYRSVGTDGFLRSTLVESNGIYTASIPSAALVADIEYFVEAYDELGNGPARIGSPEKPLHIKLSQASTTTPADTIVTTGTGTSAVDDKGTQAGNSSDNVSAPGNVDDGEDEQLMFGIIGGAIGGAVLLGAGTAVIVYMLFIKGPEVRGEVTLEVTAPPITQAWGAQ